MSSSLTNGEIYKRIREGKFIEASSDLRTLEKKVEVKNAPPVEREEDNDDNVVTPIHPFLMGVKKKKKPTVPVSSEETEEKALAQDVITTKPSFLSTARGTPLVKSEFRPFDEEDEPPVRVIQKKRKDASFKIESDVDTEVTRLETSNNGVIEFELNVNSWDGENVEYLHIIMDGSRVAKINLIKRNGIEISTTRITAKYSVYIEGFNSRKGVLTIQGKLKY